MTTRVRMVLAVLAGVILTAPSTSAQDPDARARDIVSQMTLDEKIQELHGTTDGQHNRVIIGIPRLGIPDLTMRDVTSHGWVVAPGTYQVVIGSSSRDIRLRGQIPM